MSQNPQNHHWTQKWGFLVAVIGVIFAGIAILPVVNDWLTGKSADRNDQFSSQAFVGVGNNNTMIMHDVTIVGSSNSVVGQMNINNSVNTTVISVNGQPENSDSINRTTPDGSIHQ